MYFNKWGAYKVEKQGCTSVHLQAGLGAAQCSLGVGCSNEASDKGRPTQRELEVHVLLKVSAESSQAKVVGQLEGGGGH